MNGSRVNAIVNELRGEKIDIINWSDNPAILIENALSPAKVISVMADPDDKTAGVIVPDYQLSLAIGKEGQNARLAARLTGYKIDIKSETQAIESGDLPENYLELSEGVYEEEYEETYDETYPEEHLEDECAEDEGQAAPWEDEGVHSPEADGYDGDNAEEFSQDDYGEEDEIIFQEVED